MGNSTLRLFLSDLLFALGLGILLLSAILPFATLTYSPIFRPTKPLIVLFFQADLSSLSVTYDPNTWYCYSEYFGDYWLHSRITFYIMLPVSQIIAAFAVQITTLIWGLGTLFIRRIPRGVTLILGLTVFLLLNMAYLSLDTGLLFRAERAAGFWLNFPSILLVLTSIILKKNTKR